MENAYHLILTIGEVTTETDFPSHDAALEAVVDAFIANHPDEDEVFGLGDPPDEEELRAFLSGLQLDREFAFSITEG